MASMRLHSRRCACCGRCNRRAGVYDSGDGRRDRGRWMPERRRCSSRPLRLASLAGSMGGCEHGGGGAVGVSRCSPHRRLRRPGRPADHVHLQDRSGRVDRHRAPLHCGCIRRRRRSIRARAAILDSPTATGHQPEDRTVLLNSGTQSPLRPNVSSARFLEHLRTPDCVRRPLTRRTEHAFIGSAGLDWGSCECRMRLRRHELSIAGRQA